MPQDTLYAVRYYTDQASNSKRPFDNLFVGDLKDCFKALTALTRQDTRTLKIRDLMDEGYRIEPLNMSFEDINEEIMEQELRKLFPDTQSAA